MKNVIDETKKRGKGEFGERGNLSVLVVLCVNIDVLFL